MSAKVLTGPLLDFGVTYWGSQLMREESVDLLAKGFNPTGRYGIGFFSVFMWGQHVRVTTRRPEEAQRDTRVLESWMMDYLGVQFELLPGVLEVPASMVHILTSAGSLTAWPVKDESNIFVRSGAGLLAYSLEGAVVESLAQAWSVQVDEIIKFSTSGATTPNQCVIGIVNQRPQVSYVQTYRRPPDV